MGKRKKKIPQAAAASSASASRNDKSESAPSFIESIMRIKGIYFLIFFIVLIQLFVFNDYIFLKKLYLFLDIGNDSYNLYYPSFVQIARYFRTDGIPTWSFSSGMGKSIFPDGLNNPFDFILYLLGPDRLAYGIIYVEMLKMLITGIIAYLYFRLLDFSKYTSILGGILAANVGYMILGSSGWYAHSTNVVYFFLLIYSFELYYKKSNPAMFPLAVFFVATDPFRLYIYAVFLLTYALLRLISGDGFTFKSSVIFLVKLVGLGAIGAGMCAVFSLGSLLERINSPRVSGDVNAAGSLLTVPVFGLPDRLQAATILLRFFSNDLLGTGSDFKGYLNYLEGPIFYSGLLPLLLAPQTLLSGGNRKRTAYGVFFLLWMIPLIFPFFRYALYAFMGNYFKHGLSMFIPAMTLIYGLNGLEIIRAKTKFSIPVLFATLLVLLVLLHLPYFGAAPYADMNIIDKDLKIVVSCFLIVYAGILCLMQFAGAGRYVPAVLMLLVCMELGWFSYITVNHRTALSRDQFESRTGYNDYTLDAVSYLKSNDDGFYRINKDYSSTLADINSINDAMVQGYYGTPSYSSFNKNEYIEFLKATEIIPKDQESKTRWALGLLQRPFLQAAASVKYNLVKSRDASSRDAFFKMIYSNIATFGDISILKNNFSLPLGFAYDECMLSKDYASLPKSHKDMAMFCAVVLDEKPPQLKCVGADEMNQTLTKYTLSDFMEMVGQKRAEAMKLISFSQKRIIGEISIDRPKLLFFSIPMDAGWQATDNGTPLTLIKSNIGFIGVLLDQGVHHIDLKFRVRYLSETLSITLASLAVYLIFVLRKGRYNIFAGR